MTLNHTATLLDRRGFLTAGGAMVGASFLPASIRAQGVAGLPEIPGVPAARPESVGVAPDLTARLNAFMRSQISEGRLTGGVTAVARRGKLIHFASHGLLEPDKGTPMTDDRIFRMMSSGKPVTGVALLQQIEAGHVALDDKISRFIPELRDFKVRMGGGTTTVDLPAVTESANRDITVRDLATHTSGLDGVLLNVPSKIPFTLAARVPYARDIPLDFQPGTRWAYSAVTGPDILARIVEITSGLSFDHYLRERIFEPVGMRDTGFNLTREQRARVVPRYARANDTWFRGPDDTELANKLLPRTAGENPIATYFSGSFGLFSTPHDYLLFETMLLNKGTINGRRVLRPESVALMQSNLVGNLYDGGIAYPGNKGAGFGILVRTILDADMCGCGRAKGAFGWGGAYGTTSWTDPANELVAVYFVQQRVLKAEAEFGRVIYQSLLG